jgi:hypothetical protein
MANDIEILSNQIDDTNKALGKFLEVDSNGNVLKYNNGIWKPVDLDE